MSNFNCDKCNKPILEGEDGHYITGCEHYPIETTKKISNKELHSYEFDTSKYVIMKSGVRRDHKTGRLIHKGE